MELKITLDKKTQELITSLIQAIQDISLTQIGNDNFLSVDTRKVKEVQEELQEPKEELQEPKNVNYEDLRKRCKKAGITLVHAKRQDEVKALTASFGVNKIDLIPDDKLEAYLEAIEGMLDE